MAEALLRQHLDEEGLRAGISSCGRLGDGTPAAAHAVTVMRERLLDITAHRSRPLTRAVLQGTDLVLTMERAHILDVAAIEMTTWTRTFTLPELVRRALVVGRRGLDEPLSSWVARVHDGRLPGSMLDGSTADDVADPIGGPLRDFRACAGLLDSLLEQLVALAFDPRAS